MICHLIRERKICHLIREHKICHLIREHKICHLTRGHKIIHLIREHKICHLIREHKICHLTRGHKIIHLTRTQDMSPYTRTQDMSPYARTQDHSSYTRTQDLSPYTRTQDVSPYVRQDARSGPSNKAQGTSNNMNPYMRIQDRNKTKPVNNVFETLANSNLSNIHVKIHKKNLMKVYWTTQMTEIEGEPRYTTNLNPHSNLVHLVYPSHCGGTYDQKTGLWWYVDERHAKAATYFIYLQELAKMKVIKDPQHLNDGSKLF